MRLVIWAGGIAFALDQITKYVVIHGLGVSALRSIDVAPPFLRFIYGENRGINFGLFGGGSEASRWILIALAVVICAGVLIWAKRTKLNFWSKISAGILIGGALGNVFDRLAYGYVLDFLNMSCCGINNPFVFNVADIFIFAGAFGLILFPETPPKAKPKRKKT